MIQSRDVRSLVVGSTVALFALSSSPAIGPGPITAAQLSSRAKGDQAAAMSRRGACRDQVGCGYPLVGEKGFALRFYWLAVDDGYYPDEDHVSIFSRQGFFIGTYPSRFIESLLMEGSGVLSDGRVISYSGRCRCGV